MQTSRSMRRNVPRCILETLEKRQLLSVVSAPWPEYVGPLVRMNHPGSLGVSPGSGPVASLIATPLNAAGTREIAFQIAYRDDAAVRESSIDDQDVLVRGPDGYQARARLVGIDPDHDAPLCIARYQAAAPDGGWTSGQDRRYQIVLGSDQVFDVHNNAAGGGIVGELTIHTNGSAATNGGTPGPSIVGVDIRDFGAIPGDGVDDSDAIQAAIDSLPFSDGAPSGEAACGGIVLFPPGVTTITRSIMLRNGITLRGAGSGISFIHDISSNRDHPAILIHSPYTHHWNIGSSVESLGIIANAGGGIWVDPNMGGSVEDLHLADLWLSTAGPGIDLHHQAVYHSAIDNIEIYNPGSTALRTGRYDGEGANLAIRNIRVTGTARPGFVAEQGMVMIINDALVQGLKLAYTGANVVPLYLNSGGLNSSAQGATLFDVDIQVPKYDCPGGVAVEINDVSRADFDRLKGVGADKRLKLIKAHDVQIAELETEGSATLDSIVVKDDKSYVRLTGSPSDRLARQRDRFISEIHAGSPAPTVIDARDFGVIPDDGMDDTAAIQAAIDSLPRGDGIPGGSTPVGGVVQLPVGAMTTTAPLKVPSGVWLRGHNNGTVIRNLILNDPNRALIELTSPYAHHSNIGAGVVELGLYATGQVSGIKSDSTITGELKYFRMGGVRVRVGGPSIDLRNARVNYATIERVTISHPGALAIWVGRPDNTSVGNRIRGVRITKVVRPNFIVDKAMFVFHGDTTMEGGSIEDGWPFESTTPMLALYASGKLTANGVYMEYAKHPSNIAWLLDNVSGSIDRLYHISRWRRIAISNGSRVTMRSLNIDGYQAFLYDCITFDATSRFAFNTVNAQFDSGLLDHPQITVKGFYNKGAGTFVDMSVANIGSNLIKDPNLSNVSDNLSNPGDWQIVWEDGLSGPRGTWSVETVDGVKRLKLVVPSPTYFDVQAKFTVPASAVGKKALVSYRVDAPPGVTAVAWNWANSEQIVARAMGSQTAGINPMPLRANDAVWINVGSVANLVPAGTYYFWRIRAVAT